MYINTDPLIYDYSIEILLSFAVNSEQQNTMYIIYNYIHYYTKSQSCFAKSLQKESNDFKVKHLKIIDN